MIDQPSLVSLYLPSLSEWWGILLASPWFSLGLVTATLLSVRRHSEIAYGSHHSKLLSFLIVLVYLAGLLVRSIPSSNHGMLAMVLILMLSDGIVLSLSRSRSTYFVFDLGLILGLLFLFHPSFTLISLYTIAKLRTINSATTRHLLAFVGGHITVLALYVMFFSTRNWESITTFAYSWVTPLALLQWPEAHHYPLLLLDLAFLLSITVGIIQLLRASTVRVRVAMSFHIQLAWLLMLINLLYGIQDGGSYIFLVPSLFLSGVMADYLLIQKETRWLLLPLLILAVATTGARAWLTLQ